MYCLTLSVSIAMSVQRQGQILRHHPFRIHNSIRHRRCNEGHKIDEREMGELELSYNHSSIPCHTAYPGSVALEGECVISGRSVPVL
jgi:hypothetical protein